MKKSVLIVAFSLVVPLVAKAYVGRTIEVDGVTYEYREVSGTSDIRVALLAMSETHPGHVEIPEYLNVPNNYGGTVRKKVVELYEHGDPSETSNLGRLVGVVIPSTVLNVSERFMGSMFGSLETIDYGSAVTAIVSYTCYNLGSLTSVTFPAGLQGIGESSFVNCTNLHHVVIPSTVTAIGGNAFYRCFSLRLSLAPGNIAYKMLDGSIYSMDGTTHIWTPSISVEVLNTTLRASDPTIMDVSYIVRGGYETVDVRSLAFKDGVRSWANVVRPESLVNAADGSPSELGNALTLNEVHSFSWRVSDDYSEPLAKFQIEIFVRPESLLPMDFTMIPQNGSLPALEVSSNPQTQTDVMNALYWLYADKTEDLTLSNGNLSAAGVLLVSGTKFDDGGTQLDPDDDGANAAKYVIGKMGYSCLSTDNHLERVNAVARLGLNPMGLRQYAVKEIVP